MQVGDLMTRNPACATVDTPLVEVARMMLDRGCGCVPVLGDDGRPIGVVTDRDIACRVIALGRDPRRQTAGEMMTRECVSLTVGTSAERCAQVLEENRIRRAIVVDDAGRCIGIVALADIARRSAALAGAIVVEVSRPSREASDVH